eukprot:COSAG04_NODE_2559_length_3930_cov_234.160794_2_plen_306_part_00
MPLQNLGMTDWKGSKNNNLLELNGMTTQIYLDEGAPDSERFKIVTGSNGAGGIAVSADGIHWGEVKDLQTETHARWDTPKNLVWDPARRQWIIYVRSTPTIQEAEAGSLRVQSYVHSLTEDFMGNWSVATPDGAQLVRALPAGRARGVPVRGHLHRHRERGSPLSPPPPRLPPSLPPSLSLSLSLSLSARRLLGLYFTMCSPRFVFFFCARSSTRARRKARPPPPARSTWCWRGARMAATGIGSTRWSLLSLSARRGSSIRGKYSNGLSPRCRLTQTVAANSGVFSAKQDPLRTMVDDTLRFYCE